MKSKKEIEQLAETYSEKIMEVAYYNFPLIPPKETVSKIITALLVEYTNQGQEDMVDMRYTEKQLLDAMSFAECYIIEHDKPLFLKSDGKPVPDCLEYINSLNKQDHVK